VAVPAKAQRASIAKGVATYFIAGFSQMMLSTFPDKLTLSLRQMIIYVT
jgi:hypothetical protein